jgi:hypothetical protein
VALSIISLVVALIALAVNVSALARRPRIVAEWGYVQDDPPREGLAVIITARRRSIEVDEVGVVVVPGGTRRRQVPEWLHADRPLRLQLRAGSLPRRLQDGESIRAFGDLDWVIDEIHDEPGTAYAFVRASGTVYLARDSKLQRRLRRRVGEAR